MVKSWSVLPLASVEDQCRILGRQSSEARIGNGVTHFGELIRPIIGYCQSGWIYNAYTRDDRSE